MSGLARVRRPTRPQAMAIAVVAVVVVISGLLLRADFTARPSASPGGSSVAGSPAVSEGPWADLELAPLERVASLEPARSDATGVAPDSPFTLISLTGEPSTTLAARLEVVPAIDFEVRPQGTD